MTWISVGLLALAGSTAACVGAVATQGGSGEQPSSTPEPSVPGAAKPRGGAAGAAGTSDPASGTSAPAGPAAAGAVVGDAPLRRLTREQYENTVRDLLGVSFVAATQISADEVAAGFRANSSVAVQELQVEEYQAAAQAIAAQALAPAQLKTLAPCAAGASEAACAASFVTSFGKRAFRRPLATAEADRYGKVYQTARDNGGDFAAGIGLVIEALLQSPNFLYRPEPGLPTPRANGSLDLSGYEVATRLSYFLWSTMPDDALFAAAEADQLRTAAQVDAQVTRMLKDARAGKTLTSFVEQWLDLGDLPTLERDTKLEPLFSPALRTAMREEIGRFADQVLRQGDGRLETLLTSRQSFVNGPLAQLYGLANTAGDAASWKSVTLPAKERSGLLTLAGVMATHAHADQSSLVRRGYLVRARLLCQTPPPPPPNLMIKVPKVDPTLSARARFEMHRSDPTCASCHALMDPLGAPFEVYGPVGRYRTMDGQQKVDSSGEITGTTASDGPVSDPVDLMTRLSSEADVRACVVKQWFRYAFARTEGDGDATTLNGAGAALDRNDHRFLDVVRAVATSDAFRTRAAFARN